MREALAYIDQSIFAESRGGRSDARKTIVLMLTTPEAESVEIKSTLTRLHALSYVLFFYIFQYFSFKTTSPDLQYQCQTSDLSLSRNLLKGKRLSEVGLFMISSYSWVTRTFHSLYPAYLSRSR